MQITIIGSGYVGLVSGACFADFGYDVVCVDKDVGKIDALKNRRIPIFEPGLDDLVMRNVASGRLNFTTDLSESVGDADAVFIAVGTPSRRGDGHADLSYVFAAAEEIARALKGFTVIVDQVDGAGRHRRRGRTNHPRNATRRPNSPSSLTRNSCAKAPRSTISSGPTAS